MSFGGFGGIPRKPGGKHEPVLGPVKGIQPANPNARPQKSPLVMPAPITPAGLRGRPGGVIQQYQPPPAAVNYAGPNTPIPYTTGAGSIYSVIILSKISLNLKACLAALFRCEPDLPHERVIVIDDGAGPGCVRYFPRVRYIKGVSPFIFARNANIGIQAAGSDVVLLNDDAFLMTIGGISEISKIMSGSPHIGLCSASIFNGMTAGSPNQAASGTGSLRRETTLLPFVCVYIPKHTIDTIGLLDERFVGYGYEDNDYCLRVSRAGLAMGIHDGCVVDHGKKERSTFRIQPDVNALHRQNRLRFEGKWAPGAPVQPMPALPATATEKPPTATEKPPTPTERLRVSCILTSYNRPTLVRQALKSLQDQTHRNFEVLLFDDSSQMDIRPILAEFNIPLSHLFVNKVTPKERRSVNRLSVNINRGLAMATGDLICFLADDDYYFPTWFESASAFFIGNPTVNVGYGKLIYSTLPTMDFNVNNQMRFPGGVITNPFEKVDHNQVIHRRFSNPYRWPEEFKTISNPDAHYFKAVSGQHPFHPIDAYAAVKRMHWKNLQRTVIDVVSEQAENIRE